MTLKLRARAVCVFSLIIMSPNAVGAISFDEVLEQALKKSPAARAVEIQSALAESEALAVATRPNPELSLEGRPVVSGGEDRDIEFEVGVSQQLRRSDFGARAQVAELIQSARTMEQRTKLQEFNQTLLLAYGKAWTIQEKQRFATEALKRIERLAATITATARTGLVPGSTEKLFVAEKVRLAAELSGINADRSRAFAELTRISGVSFAGEELSELKFAALPDTLGELPNHGSELERRLKLRQEIAAAQLRVARLDATPAFAPRLAFEHTSDGDDRINIGVTVGLPFSDSNRGEVSRLTAEQLSHQVQREYLEGGRFSEETNLLLTATRLSLEQFELYRNEVIPACNQAFAAAERELKAGQGSAVQLWQPLSQLASAQDRYLELWIKALSERVELAILLGHSL